MAADFRAEHKDLFDFLVDHPIEYVGVSQDGEPLTAQHSTIQLDSHGSVIKVRLR